ncbi:hypothetical protein AK812_SmicGene23398 [Symbiodinium microadriaticum]|uniref:C3H1-type domain-containing protein n=1 Tax=Symbiodinium microadriaticum TaxID=2951 RepID=A0A1Q9DHB9_SYMMI|nr:hypothetical protein AK812_SmicGene23398 [Symbiodinium microadriaticum]
MAAPLCLRRFPHLGRQFRRGPTKGRLLSAGMAKAFTRPMGPRESKKVIPKRMMAAASELRISYCKTFIHADVLGEDQKQARLPQSASSPDLGHFADLAEDVHKQDLNEAKPIRAGPGLGGLGDTAPLTAKNQGSRGHPFLCRRPCVHILCSGSCFNGDACSYCHFPHEARSKLDSRQRVMSEAMPKAQLLFVVRELLEKQAEAIAGNAQWEILNVLKEEMDDAEHSATDASNSEEVDFPRAVLRKFRKSLSKMNFAGLVSFTSRRCTDQRKMRLLQILESLRAGSDMDLPF